MNFAIIVAAGDGERMKLSTPTNKTDKGLVSNNKIFLELFEGYTILDSALNNLWQSGIFDGMVIVSRAVDLEVLKEKYSSLERCQFLCNAQRDNIEKLLSSLEFVEGGASRQESVFRGLEHVKGRAATVAIHDAARPFCSPQLVRLAVEAVSSSGAACLASRVVSTLKLGEAVYQNGEQYDPSFAIKKTISREGLWEAQTPQVFDFHVIYQAHRSALESGVSATDDCELVELFGFSITIIESTRMNLKITTAEDYQIAKLLV